VVLILAGAFLLIAPVPFSVFPREQPGGDATHLIRTGTTRLREAVATPRFAIVVKGQENPDATAIEFEERKPIIEVPKTYSDRDVALILAAAFPTKGKSLVDPTVERVRFTGWEILREAVEVPYRFFFVFGVGLVVAGAGALLWRAGSSFARG